MYDFQLQKTCVVFLMSQATFIAVKKPILFSHDKKKDEIRT